MCDQTPLKTLALMRWTQAENSVAASINKLQRLAVLLLIIQI